MKNQKRMSDDFVGATSASHDNENSDANALSEVVINEVGAKSEHAAETPRTKDQQ